jgi:hypothetical protein
MINKIEVRRKTTMKRFISYCSKPDSSYSVLGRNMLHREPARKKPVFPKKPGWRGTRVHPTRLLLLSIQSRVFGA